MTLALIFGRQTFLTWHSKRHKDQPIYALQRMAPEFFKKVPIVGCFLLDAVLNRGTMPIKITAQAVRAAG